MAATKLYVDQTASAATLWQGVYDPTTNTPDLTDPAVQNHGWSWTVNVAGNTAANLPGVPAGTPLQVGDVLQWIGSSSTYAIIAGGPLTEVEADARYLRLDGGTMTGSLILAADPLVDLEAATKQYVDNHTTNLNYVAITGDTMTGNLAIDTTGVATSASLSLTRDAGLMASIYGYSGPNVRWAMDLGDNTPETGTNTGSNFLLSCYTDAGMFINSPLKIIRASGDALVDHDPTQPLGIATKQYVDQASLPPANSNLDFQVATTGDDITGDDSVAAPFATIQHALDIASEYDYQSKYYVTINIANGTYVENIRIPTFKSIGYGPNWYDGGIFLVGDTVSPNGTAPLVVIDGGGGVCLTNKNTGVAININGITLVCSSRPKRPGLGVVKSTW
jgi:hypothetical protein